MAERDSECRGSCAATVGWPGCGPACASWPDWPPPTAMGAPHPSLSTADDLEHLTPAGPLPAYRIPQRTCTRGAGLDVAPARRGYYFHCATRATETVFESWLTT